MTMNLRALLDAPMVPDIVVSVWIAGRSSPVTHLSRCPVARRMAGNISAAFERGASAVLCEAEGALSRVILLSGPRALPVGCVGQPILWVAVEALTLSLSPAPTANVGG